MQTIFAGAADADERPGNMLKIDRKIFATEMQIGMVGAIPAWAATSLAKSAQRASLTSAVGPAYQDVNLRAKALLSSAAISLTRALTAAALHSVVRASPQLDALRQHVPGIASLDPRHAEHHRVEVFTSQLATLYNNVTSWLASRIASLPSCGRAACAPFSHLKRSTLA